MRIALLTVLIATATPAFAATTPDAPSTAVMARTGQVLRDASNVRIGAVDSVKADGSVGVIVDGRYVVIPASTLGLTDGKLTTTLTKKAVTGAK